jgi:hypothetical protein
MLDHGLEVVAYALKLRQSHLLPCGAPPETQAAQNEAWTAGIAYAALLHDLGKIAVDLHVEYGDGQTWHPWHGTLARPYRVRYRKDRQYRLHGAAAGLIYHRVLDPAIMDWLSAFPELWTALLYTLSGHYEYAGELGELVVRADQASVAQAIGGDPGKALTAPKHALQRKLLDGLRYLLNDELKLNQPQASDGWLTDDALWLVSKTVCDKLRAHLLAQGVGGIPENNTTVFNVLQEHGIALPSSDGKAVWTATVTSETGWHHRFTFLKVAPALIWDADARPDSFTGQIDVLNESTAVSITPKAPLADQATDSSPPIELKSNSLTDSVDSLLNLFDLQPTDTSVPLASDFPTKNALLCPAAENEAISPGHHFMDWLENGIRSHKLLMNDAKALIHTVDNTLFLVSPGLFHRYTQEHPNLAKLAIQQKIKDWEWAQKQFEQLKLHRKQPNGRNIWTCEVSGPRKSHLLHGYLLANSINLIEELALNNPYLRLITDQRK